MGGRILLLRPWTGGVCTGRLECCGKLLLFALVCFFFALTLFVVVIVVDLALRNLCTWATTSTVYKGELSSSVISFSLLQLLSGSVILNSFVFMRIIHCCGFFLDRHIISICILWLSIIFVNDTFVY